MIRFRSDVEGLRAVAVLLVILNHLGVAGFGGGFIGVDVFFVISGFLITSLLAAEHARAAEHGRGRISIPAFYLRRARRILPAAVLVVATTLLAAHLLLNPLRADEIRHDAIWALLFGSNINFIHQATDYFQQGLATSPLQHYWSLAVEEQFYLVWPALFALTTRLRSPRSWERRVTLTALLVLIASLAWSVSDTASDPASAYFSTLTRSWELALGALVAIAARRPNALPARTARALAGAGVALLTLACLTIDDTTPFPGAAALLPTLGTAAILLAGTSSHTTIVARLLSIPPARFLGRISYSMYLWHWPLITFAQALYPIGSGSVAGRLALLATTITISTASYHLIEQPFRRLGHHPAHASGTRAHHRGRIRARRRQLGASLVGATAAVAVVWGLLPSAGANARPRPVPPPAHAPAAANAPAPPAAAGTLVQPTWSDAVRAGLALTAVPPGLLPVDDHKHLVPGRCEGKARPSPHDPTCVWGDARARLRVVLLGDSHALMFAPALRGALAGRRYRGSVIWKGHCGWEANDGHLRYQEGCPAFQAAEHRELARLHPDLLILSEVTDGTPSMMAAALRQLKPLAKRIVILAHTPKLPAFDVCLGAGWDITTCSADRPGVGAERRAARAAGATFVDPNAWLCTGTRCPPIIDGTIVYLDGMHITNEFSPKLASLLRAALAWGQAGTDG